MKESLRESIEVKRRLLEDREFWAEMANISKLIGATLRKGKKILVIGNGGSAADAQHFAAEFVATFRKEKRRGYPVLALTTDTSLLTAWTNDFGVEDVFARQVEAHGRPGDLLIAISTSGNSTNVLRAVALAKKRGLVTVGLLGGNGGKLKSKMDHPLIVPSDKTARIQEAHITILHLWCEEVVPKLT